MYVFLADSKTLVDCELVGRREDEAVSGRFHPVFVVTVLFGVESYAYPFVGDKGRCNDLENVKDGERRNLLCSNVVVSMIVYIHQIL